MWFGNLNNGGCKKICDFVFYKNSINKKVNYYKDIEDILNDQIEQDKLLMKEKDI